MIVEPCNGSSEILQLLQQDIDSSTGLVLGTYDLADFGTSLAYDLMGRIVREDPGAGASVLHHFLIVTPTSSNSTPSHQVEHCDPNFGGVDCPNDSRRYSSKTTYFDGLSRPKRSAIAFPSHGNSELNQSRTVDRDSAGRASFESTWLAPLGTSYTGYDRFGGVGTIQPSGEDPVKFTYVGDRKTTRELKVAITLSGTTSVSPPKPETTSAAWFLSARTRSRLLRVMPAMGSSRPTPTIRRTGSSRSAMWPPAQPAGKGGNSRTTAADF